MWEYLGDDKNKSTVLGWYASIKKQMAINPKLTETMNLVIKNYLPLKNIIDSGGIKGIDDLNKQKINELKTSDNLKKFTGTQDGTKIAELAELTDDIDKTPQADYEDKDKSPDEKLKFVLEYVYDHANENNPIYSYSDIRYKLDLLLILRSIIGKLNKTR